LYDGQASASKHGMHRGAGQTRIGQSISSQNSQGNSASTQQKTVCLSDMAADFRHCEQIIDVWLSSPQCVTSINFSYLEIISLSFSTGQAGASTSDIRGQKRGSNPRRPIPNKFFR
jgi:hypothetical protein